MSVDLLNGICFRISFWRPELAATFLEDLCVLVIANKYVNTILLRW
jgi:hypothetical protein